VCCGVLRCVAVCCSVLQTDTIPVGASQHIATHCSVLHYGTVCCSELQSVADREDSNSVLCCIVVCYSVLHIQLLGPGELSATHCNTQLTNIVQLLGPGELSATHCNTQLTNMIQLLGPVELPWRWARGSLTHFRWTALAPPGVLRLLRYVRLQRPMYLYRYISAKMYS